MEILLRNLILVTTLMLAVINLKLYFASGAFGVNYGMLGDNLPPPQDVVNFYKNQNIQIMRLFEPNPDVLNALRGSGIRVCMGVRNQDVEDIANSVDSATQWVNANVMPYVPDVNFGWISVGNEMVPGDEHACLIPKAMDNIFNALKGAGLTGVAVSTAVSNMVLGDSYPPSVTNFNSDSMDVMKEITKWLAATNNPLLANVYPYYGYTGNRDNIPLEYVMFTTNQPVIDGEYQYYSLFEAMMDAFFSALEKNEGPNVGIVVAETGWPTAGDDPVSSIQNAQTYNQNLINKMKVNGTPKRPGCLLDIMIFSLFNENQKPEGIERNWGIKNPDMTPIYPLTF